MPGPAAWHAWLVFGEAAIRFLCLNWACQATALLVAGLMVSRLPRLSAAHRHLALLAALVLAAVAPVSGLLPARYALRAPFRPASVISAMAAGRATQVAVRTAAVTPALPGRAQLSLAVAHPGFCVLALWLVVVLVRLARLQGGLWAVSGWRRGGRAADRDRLYSACRYSVADIRVLESPFVPMPCVAGLTDPCILLPAGMTETLDVADLRNVLFHEEAHARRRDPLWFFLTEVCYSVLFWHPLARIVRRQVGSLAEDACDAHVLGRGAPGTSYARTLLAVLEHTSAARPSAALCPFGNGGSELRRRVVRILAGTPRSSTLVSALGSATLGVVGATTLLAQVGDRPALPKSAARGGGAPAVANGRGGATGLASARRIVRAPGAPLPAAPRFILRNELPALRNTALQAPFAQLDLPRDAQPRDKRCVVFVLDTTPGMTAHALEARLQILTMARALSPDDQFNVVSFASDVRQFAETPVAPGVDSLAAAQAWMENLAPSEGGTAPAAVQQALTMPEVSSVVVVSADAATPRSAGWAQLVSVAGQQNPYGAGVLSLDLGQTPAGGGDAVWTEMPSTRDPELRAVQKPAIDFAP